MCAMDQRPAQRPEGALIAAALKRSRMSQRQAAAKVGISENRLRAIVHGYQNVSAGVFAPVRGPAETVARIAEVVGVSPEDLEDVGRADAAEALRILLGRRRPPTEEEVRSSRLQPETKDALLSLRRRIDRWEAELKEEEIRLAERLTRAQEDERDAG